MDSFDFIVIGGGMMGAPCARHLAEGGASVALVAAPEPEVKTEWQGPFGSHFDAARITRRVGADRDWSLLSRRSIDRYRDIETRTGKTIFHETGALMAGPEDGPMSKFTQDFLAVAAALDNPPEVLEVASAWERMGLALPDETLATFEVRRGGWLDPRAMRDAQTALAHTAGAKVFAQAATARDGGVVTLADGGRIAGGHVVVATGPHAASDGLLPRKPAMKVWARTVAFARLSEAEGARLASLPSVIWVPEGWQYDLYMLPPVRYPDGRLYLKIGGQVDGPRIHSAAEMRAWFHGAGDAEVGAQLLAEMRTVLPGLEAEATHTGPCAVVWSETGYPYIDAAAPGVTVLCGGNGAAAKSGDEIGRLGAMTARGESLTGEGYATDFHAVWQEVTASAPPAAAT
ncbi:Monomeric sarcosine oxidase [Jannaschia seosinensis]|uniref:Monomeric sarcosine oxidase n=1 Tax=Jannaschia seosinensis TaxID=313367 RepID=A0A0M7BBL6_9RHOB|nr:FAD-dependent oxidoreductase [Jannaschia seosinensis]CUH38173.1 Monomeric sarcosine oxidase [Jannaschia seosinensis]